MGMNNRQTEYSSPKVRVIEVVQAEVLCLSNDFSVTNAWEGNEEEEW